MDRSIGILAGVVIALAAGIALITLLNNQSSGFEDFVVNIIGGTDILG